MLSSERLPKSCEALEVTIEKSTYTLRNHYLPFFTVQRWNGPLMTQLVQYEKRVMSYQSKGRLVSHRALSEGNVQKQKTSINAMKQRRLLSSSGRECIIKKPLA